MIDFEFVSPTKIYFGKEKEMQIGSICRDFNYKKAVIVIGMGSVKRSGLLDKIEQSLNESEVEYVVFEGVRPNPTINMCYELIGLAKQFKPDVLLAVGGGSVADVAKNAACGYYYDGDSFDFNLHKVVPKKALPVGVVLTISAAGSELSGSCVVQNDETKIKNGFFSNLIRPVFVIENPELSYGVSRKQTAYGIVDIMMHTMERFFSESKTDNEPADEFAIGLLKSVIKAGKVAYLNPNDYDSRGVLMLMSSLSHNGLTNIGKTMIMPVHQLEHALSGAYPDVAHGEGLALLWPKWAKYYAEIDTKKFARFARELFGIDEKDDLKCAYKGIEEIQKIYDFLDMPRKYSDLGIDNVDTYELAKLCTWNDTRPLPHHVKSLDCSEVKKIYDMCI